MKYATFELRTPLGTARRVGIVTGEGLLLDLNAAYADVLAGRIDPERARLVADAVLPSDLVGVLANGSVARDAVAQVLAELGDDAARANRESNDGACLVHRQDDVRLLAPVPRPRSLRDCSAFEEHVKNASGEGGVPRRWYDMPVYYKGNPDSIAADGDDVVRPPGVKRLDYELEFAWVIGKRGRDIAEDGALEHVAGYMVFNDVSSRDLQFREMSVHLGPAKGKDADGTNVLGPYLVTPDEFDPAEDHLMTARVDGEEWSKGLTSSIYHPISRIVSYISGSETLHVGDVIGAGTVGGGSGLEVGRYPEMGQVVELEVEGLGVLRNRFVDASAA
jgi:2-keto-4-pentenoate hydratase/2-oxohepta-3-ene-1,7-dioic acid hydratase in catechol pathway